MPLSSYSTVSLLICASKKVLVAGLMIAVAILVLYFYLILSRYDESITVTDFSRPIAVSATVDMNVVLLMKMKTQLNKPITFQLLSQNYKHYEFTLVKEGVREISVDWYSPELELVFVDAESVSGSIEIDYSF